MKKILFLGLLVLAGCKTTKYVPVETVRTDTLYVSKLERDSIVKHDSVYFHVYEKGDTVYSVLTKWKTEYRDRYHTDTVYVSKTDSIPVPYPIEKELKWRERKAIALFPWTLLVAVGLGAWCLRRPIVKLLLKLKVL